jgi:hypothetical protein
VVVTDQDNDQASSSLVVSVQDDVAQAQGDVAGTAEDTAITVNVLANDVVGADQPGVVTGAVLLSGGGVLNGFTGGGAITVSPANGYAGALVVEYTLMDADGDISKAQLTITVGSDSEPEVSISYVDGAQGLVDEAALASGSNALSDAETTSGSLVIGTGGDALSSVVIDGVDVTGGGQVVGQYGVLTVVESNGSYGWSYTLGGNTTDHTGQGTGSAGVGESFSVVVTDQDGDVASDSLVVSVLDDVPGAQTDSIQ